MVFPRPLRHLVLIIALIALTASVAAAHVPQFSGGWEGLDNARVVNDPTKSWVIYTTYDGPDHVDYYKMSFKEGELMLVGVIVPVTEGERGLAPSMVLMGPGLDDNAPSHLLSRERTGASCPLIRKNLQSLCMSHFRPAPSMN